MGEDQLQAREKMAEDLRVRLEEWAMQFALATEEGSDEDWEEWDRETEQKCHEELNAVSCEDLVGDYGYIEDDIIIGHLFGVDDCSGLALADSCLVSGEGELGCVAEALSNQFKAEFLVLGGRRRKRLWLLRCGFWRQPSWPVRTDRRFFGLLWMQMRLGSERCCRWGAGATNGSRPTKRELCGMLRTAG